MAWLRRFERLLIPLMQVWFALTRRMTLGVRVLVVNAQGEVLLVRPAYRRGWELPGGGVERGERAADSAVRELWEEAGLRALERPRLVSIHSHEAHFKGDHVLVYTIERWETGERPAGREIEAVGWFHPDQLPEALNPGTLRRINERLTGSEPNPDW